MRLSIAVAIACGIASVQQVALVRAGALDAGGGDASPTATVSGSGESLSPDDPRSLQEIVVTAQKREEKLQNVPISVSVMSGANLDKSTFIDTRDALATLPGVATFTSGNSGGTMLSVRGVSSTSDLFAGSSPVAYYVDGVPFGLIRSAIVPDANLYDLQRIEVLNGPQGTLYGASALNGVVRILTNDADLRDFDFKGRATSSSTDHGGDNYDGDMAVNIPIVTDKLAVRLVAGDQHFSGWINTSYGNHTNDIDIGNERLKLAAQPTDTLSIGVSAWHSQVSAGDVNYADSDYFIPQQHGQPYSQFFNAYGFTVKQQLEWFDLSSVTSYLDYDDRGNLDVSPLNFDFVLYGEIRSKVASEELNITSKSGSPWRWSAGLFYRDAADITYQTDTLYFNSSTPIFGDQFRDTSKSYAVFGEIGRDFFADQLEVTAGARYFHDDEGTQAWGTQAQLADISGGGYSLVPQSAKASVGTPRATISWKPRQDLTAYFSYGQGFRSGFPQDYFVQSLFAPAAPDKLTNYELGIKGTAFDERIAYTAAGYYIHWTGVQQSLSYVPTAGPLAGIGEAVVANAQSASGPGAEFSIITHPLTGWDVSASFSWNDLTYDRTVYSDITSGAPLFLKGDRLNVSPEFTGYFSTSYELPLGASEWKGRISASEQYTSVLDTAYVQLGKESNLPSNSMLIARANISLIAPEHWSVALFADNLANYNGSIQTSSDSSIYWQTRVPPRTVGVRFDYHMR